MSTLAEIETAAKQLPLAEKQELFWRLGEQLRTAGKMPEPREYSAEQIAAWIKEDEEDGAAFRAGR